MPTDNKKISAYVPDVVYDRFIQYKDEHKLSMSQAAIEIFATHFGINLNPTISNESTGELLGRVDTLEKELLGLKIHFKLLSEQVDLMQSTSESLITEPVEVSVDKNINSEPDSSLQDELPKEDIIEQPIDPDIIDEFNSGSDSELPRNSNHQYFEPPLFGDLGDLLSSLKNNPLEAKTLAIRLGVKPPDISIKKGKVSSEDFYNWLQSKDIDGIRWVLVGEGKKARYIPADDTPINKLQLLKDWLQANT